MGSPVIDTGEGSVLITDVDVAAGRLFLDVVGNRVLVHDIGSGERIGRLVGAEPSVAVARGLVAVSTGSGRVRLHSLETLEVVAEHTFANDVMFAELDDRGGRLHVLTDDQTLYELSLPELAAAETRPAARPSSPASAPRTD